MAVATVAMWRPLHAKAQEFIATVAQARKIHERIGATVRVWQTAFGGEPMTWIYVIEHKGWKEFGDFGHKIEADSEWQQLIGNFLAKPSAELVQSSVITQPPGLS